MVCITAPGDEHDFVSRFFCPGESVPEDPVTGSTHSMLIPYWADKLGKPFCRPASFQPVAENCAAKRVAKGY
jgi:predicted PhzF superfamily epimerase YddE/YHI9